jgi:hypothetical protein
VVTIVILQRSNRSHRFLLLAVGLVPLATTGPASAQTRSVSATTHTLGVGSEVSPLLDASDSRTAVTLYQFLELATEDMGVDGLQVELSGVAGVDAGDRRFDGVDEATRARGNLIVGLVRWQDRAHRTSIAVGRQYLYLGAGRAEHLDGANITYRLPGNVDLTAFGGRTRPWQLDYEPDDGAVHVSNEDFLHSNWAAGGRARFSLLDRGVASVSFIHEGEGSETVRQNLAFQAGYWSTAKIEALAGGILDVYDMRLQEMWVALTSRWWSKLKLSADYRFMVPSLTIPKTSIFSVFTLDDYHSAALGAYYAFTPRVWASVDGGPRFYTGDGSDSRTGYHVAGTLRVVFDSQRRGQVGLRSEMIDASDQWSLQNRLFTSYRFKSGLYGNIEAFLLVLGADNDDDATASDYERRIADQPLSFGGLLLAGYQITDALSAQLAGSAFSTPISDYDLRILGRLTYRGFWSWGR